MRNINMSGELKPISSLDLGIPTLLDVFAAIDTSDTTKSPEGTTKRYGSSSIKTLYLSDSISLKITRITTTGSGNFTPAPNVLFAVVKMTGGGGGSGGIALSTGESAATGGGAGASCVTFYLTKAQLTAMLVDGAIPVSVGIGGAAGAAGDNSGAPGNDTFFSTGGGEWIAGGGSGSDGATSSAISGNTVGRAGGASVIGTGTLIEDIHGQDAEGGFWLADAAALVRSGRGGDTPLGNGGTTLLLTENGNSVGFPGTGYGSGGGGTIGRGSDTTLTGVAGRPGIIIVTEVLYNID